jgi:uncharacterized protein YjbI with pentapeptide repeats
MANQQHLDLLKQGKNTWNTWRKEHPEIQPDLSEANLYKADFDKVDLSKANLRSAFLRSAFLHSTDLRSTDLRYADLRSTDLDGANLHRADLSGANLSGAYLRRVYLSGANLSGAYLNGAYIWDADLDYADLRYANLYKTNLREANLSRATLSGANLSGANLSNTDLSEANLSGANLSGANLNQALIIRTNLTNAVLNDCSIYGIAAWDVQLAGATQLNLAITPREEPTITVDNLEVAQFIYLLLNNERIRHVIDTITSKVVLILGRFTPAERKNVLDALRDELRKYDYLPVVFDFEQPSSRNLTETISTLAHMARFIVADLTNAKSIPQELERIVPRLRVPVQPLLHISEQRPYAMFESFEDYPWVLPLYRYGDQETLLQSLQEHVISPAEQKAQTYEKRKQEAMEETEKPTT